MEIRIKSDPFELPDERFRKLFRLSKDTARLLQTKLQPFAQQSEIPFYIKILTALHFYGNGSYQASVGSNHLLGLSQPSVSRVLLEITTLINLHLLKDSVKFPKDILEVANVKEKFLRKFGMRYIIGAIDGCHVSIKAPPTFDETFPGNVYRNRKGYHSLNVLMCCDAEMRVTFADARFPGSVHDSAIWIISQLRTFLRSRFTNVENQNEFLIGDSGFPLEPWLLTPFNNPEEDDTVIYNDTFIKTRNVVEKCFGVLKSRFRCLLRHRTLHYDPTIAGRIIYACCVLHNMCINSGADMPLFEDSFIETDVDYDDDDVKHMYTTNQTMAYFRISSEGVICY